MIYGATGYTGRLAAARAQQQGLSPVLAGRQAEPLAPLAQHLGVEHRVFALDDEDGMQRALQGVGVLLNCAGQFLHTAAPLMGACLRRGVHYLDIAAELDSYLLAERLHPQAVAAQVMLLPGCGGSVPMLGDLAAHAVEQVATPVSLRIALHVSGAMSRGSAVSAGQNLSAHCLVREHDVLTPRDRQPLRDFNFGRFQAAASRSRCRTWSPSRARAA